MKTTTFLTSTTECVASLSATNNHNAGIQGVQGEYGFQGVQGFQGVKGEYGFQGVQGASSPSNSVSFYGDTGTVSVGIGVTGTTPTYAALQPLFITPFYNDTTYLVQDVIVTSTNTNVFTVPTGKKALILYYTARNTSGSSSFTYIALNLSSSYYPIDTESLTSIPTDHTVSRTQSAFYVFQAGETIAVVSSVTSDIRVTIFYCVFNAAVALVSPIKYSDWVDGDNTLYTNSAYTNGMILPSVSSGIISTTNVFQLYNGTPSFVTYHFYNVPDSETTSTLYAIGSSIKIAKDTATSSDTAFCLAYGDSIVVNSTTASDTQIVYVTLLGLL